MSDTPSRTVKKPGPSNAVLIAAVLIVLVGMGVLNSINQRLDPKEIERREQERQQAEADKQQKQQGEAGKPPQPPSTVPTGANDLAGYGDEKVLGKADGKTELTIAWEWTPEVQSQPNLVYDAVQAAVKAAPDAKIRVVNVDADPRLEPGVYLNGKKQLPAEASGAFPTTAKTYEDLAKSP